MTRRGWMAAACGLAPLAPACIDDIPADPFDGAPMEYVGLQA